MDDCPHVAGSFGRSDHVLAATSNEGLLAKWAWCHRYLGCLKLRVWTSLPIINDSHLKYLSKPTKPACATMMDAIPYRSYRDETGRMDSAALVLTGL